MVEPICYVDAGHLREVSNGNHMMIFAQSEQDRQGRLEPLYLAEAIKQERERGQIEGLQQAINTIAVHGMGYDTVIELHRMIKELK